MYCLCGRWVLVSLFKIVRLKSAAVWPEVHVQIDKIAVVGENHAQYDCRGQLCSRNEAPCCLIQVAANVLN